MPVNPESEDSIELDRADGAAAGTVFNIQRFCTQDGPGLRTTVFLKGCPLSCRWCHNPESQVAGRQLVFHDERCIGCGLCDRACERKAIAVTCAGQVARFEQFCDLCGACAEACPTEAWQMIGSRISARQVMRQVLRDRPFYEQSGGGVTFSGGEPLSQAQFLGALLRLCKTEDLHTAVDTCGAAEFKVLEGLLGTVDLFLYDLKLINETKHERQTGQSNEQILANLRGLVDSGASVVVRLPVIPGVNDDDENLRQTGAFLAGLAAVPELELLPYHAIGAAKYKLLGKRNEMPRTAALPRQRLEEIAGQLAGFGLRVRIGGGKG